MTLVFFICPDNKKFSDYLLVYFYSDKRNYKDLASPSKKESKENFNSLYCNLSSEISNINKKRKLDKVRTA